MSIKTWYTELIAVGLSYTKPLCHLYQIKSIKDQTKTMLELLTMAPCRREYLLNRLSCPADDPIGQGTELDWTEFKIVKTAIETRTRGRKHNCCRGWLESTIINVYKNWQQSGSTRNNSVQNEITTIITDQRHTVSFFRLKCWVRFTLCLTLVRLQKLEQ